MAERQYPSNSDASKQQVSIPQTTPPDPSQGIQRNLTPAVDGAQTIQKSYLDKASEFLGFNKPKTFGDWVQTIADMTNRVYSAFDTITGNRRQSSQPNTQASVPAARIAYGQFYQSQANAQAYAQPKAPAAYSFDDILYRTRGDAEVVLAQLRELIQLYKMASVNDLYDLSGITPPANGYTAAKYGWRDLSMARVVPVGAQGFMIVLPSVTQL